MFLRLECPELSEEFADSFNLRDALQWLFSRFIVEPRGHPMLAGLATGLLTFIPVAGIVLLVRALLQLLH
jgi:hypothetical protein